MLTKDQVYDELIKKLPLKRNCNDYFPEYVKSALSDYLKIVEPIYKNDNRLLTVKEFILKLESSIKYAFSGNLFESQNIFREGMDCLLNGSGESRNSVLPIYGTDNFEDTYHYEKGSTSFLFRATQYEESMWHIPYEKRFLSSSSRFSVPGLPCLYLANSIKTCLIELGEICVNKSYFVSCFEFDEFENGLLDLTMPRKIVGEPSEVYLDKSIFSWPLVALCMIKKPNDALYANANFVYEYLIPQYVISYLLSFSKIHAVKYFSTKCLNRKSWNIAIPVTEFKESGHSDKLKLMFKDHEKDTIGGYKVSKTREINYLDLFSLDEIESNMKRL